MCDCDLFHKTCPTGILNKIVPIMLYLVLIGSVNNEYEGLPGKECRMFYQSRDLDLFIHIWLELLNILKESFVTSIKIFDKKMDNLVIFISSKIFLIEQKSKVYVQNSRVSEPTFLRLLV